MSGGAINLAIQKLRDDGFISAFDFEWVFVFRHIGLPCDLRPKNCYDLHDSRLTVNYTECDRSLGAAVGMEFMRNKKLDVVIGAPCQDRKLFCRSQSKSINNFVAMEVMATMATFYKTPLLAWGLVTDSKFTDADRYPYLTNIMANSLSLGFSLVKLLEMMDWDRVALLYETSAQDYPLSIINDVETAINEYETYGVNVVVKQALPSGDANDAQYISVLNRIKSRCRIIILVIQTATPRRKYLRMITEQNMANEEYVHILLGLRSIGFGKQSAGLTKCELGCLSSGMSPVWEVNPDDGWNERLKAASTRMLVMDLSTDVPDVNYLNTFTSQCGAQVVNPPVSCATPQCLNASTSPPSAFARSLHDVFYLYGLAITNVYNQNPANLGVGSVINDAMQVTFQGLTGEVSINANNTRVPKLMLYALNEKYDQASYMNLTYSVDGGASVSLAYTNEASLWFWYNGLRPLSVPTCGFTGTECPQSFVDQYGALVFSVGGVLALALLLLITCFFYVLRQRKLERDRIDAEWQIPLVKLQKPPKREKSQMSKRSLQSAPSNITDTSKMTFDNTFSNYSIFYLDKDPVLSTAHPASNLFRADYDTFVKLRKLEHENVNKFIGLSIDGAEYLSVWKMCMRGSLQDIIGQGNFSIDPFFMFCVIRDMAEGLKYLHNSFLHVHANLRSGTVLINESWQAKLTDYGLGNLAEEKKPMKRRQLWMAPEVIRGTLLPHQIEKSADIYSLAVIASEVLTRKEAWNMSERKDTVDEIVYRIKKGGPNPPRPDLDMDGVEINHNLLILIRDCWSEEPIDRPSADVICNLLKNMMPKKGNLMDHVFNILEDYTTNLEVEVEDRTKELTAEKKKADVLLGRMLPKQVAERLKQGQTVEPEGFDSVTVFFSDVVKFTQLAAKCSPFQVVNLLNDLYSNFDAIIEEHGVYKVESIGDGYLCVSGLPTRNGNAHIKQIVELSLDFMAYCKAFKIPHLPRERVELRVGVNSGPCVAGVVGLSMPRYCLFGDTVNTASRMESNGKPSHIHLSAASYTLLMKHYPNQYNTASRGDVIIKGKGVMETFWVFERNNQFMLSSSNSAYNPDKNKKKNDDDSSDGSEGSSTPPSTPPMHDEKPNSPVRHRKPPVPSSPTLSKRSVSPIMEAKARDIHNEETEALYRQFRRQETLALI
ncbi:CRE-GCY-19 protein [Caenorhabditis remanei]|uniref:Guanylate cyclase n=1 Tax=Caenorhabditis remanei TaxID=31234 RepID=E3MZK7_CAERE|nr:CRE-GCY-19 protein [Caenorhabditis remanei]